MVGRQSQVHYSRPLTNVSIEFRPTGLVAAQILPMVPNLANRADLWPRFDKSAFDTVPDKRMHGEDAQMASRGWDYVPYLCHKHALRDGITQDMRREWDSEVDLEISTTEFLKQLVWNNYEVEVLGTGGILRKSANNSYVANEDWTSVSTVDIRGRITLAIEAVESACGMSPNVFVASPRVGRHIMRCAQYQEEFKYVVAFQNTLLPPDVYGLRPIWAEGLVNTARKGQATSLSRIMDDDVWIGYINPSAPGQRWLSYGVTLQTYEEVTSWWDDSKKADMVEYESEHTPFIVARECGALLQSVLTA